MVLLLPALPAFPQNLTREGGLPDKSESLEKAWAEVKFFAGVNASLFAILTEAQSLIQMRFAEGDLLTRSRLFLRP
jgi:hypothetical protein